MTSYEYDCLVTSHKYDYRSLVQLDFLPYLACKCRLHWIAWEHRESLSEDLRKSTQFFSAVPALRCQHPWTNSSARLGTATNNITSFKISYKG